jgi:hypothetical protein
MPKAFTFPKEKAAKVKSQLPKARRIKEQKAGPPWFVQGQDATSIEYNTSIALERLGLEYQFQYYVGGGRRLRGGQVLDFMVYTPGRNTWLNVHGRYWHTGIHNDELDSQKLEQLALQKNAIYKILWEEDCLTIDLALRWVNQNLSV